MILYEENPYHVYKDKDGPGYSHFKDRNGEIEFYDPQNNIYAVVDFDRYDPDKWLVIYEFSSHSPGKGNAAKSLQWLRNHFSHIAVSGIGSEEDDPSWKFWFNIAEKGLVNELYDDELNRVWRT